MDAIIVATHANVEIKHTSECVHICVSDKNRDTQEYHAAGVARCRMQLWSRAAARRELVARTCCVVSRINRDDLPRFGADVPERAYLENEFADTDSTWISYVCVNDILYFTSTYHTEMPFLVANALTRQFVAVDELERYMRLPLRADTVRESVRALDGASLGDADFATDADVQVQAIARFMQMRETKKTKSAKVPQSATPLSASPLSATRDTLLCSTPRIVVIAVGWNEAAILPLFLDHYMNCADKIVYYDNESTDNTRAIIQAHACAARIEVRTLSTSHQIRDDVLLNIKNHVWKEFKDTHDWAIVVDVDEIIVVPSNAKDGRALSNALAANADVGALRCTGFQMIDARKGARCTAYDKITCWNLARTIETNYAPGCHRATPRFADTTCTVRDGVVQLRHVRFTQDFRTLCARVSEYQKRLSDINRRNNWGAQYQLTRFKKEYLHYQRTARDMSELSDTI